MTAGPFRRVLVGWDASSDAAEALGAAVSIAVGEGGHVVALAVVQQAPSTEAADDHDRELAAIRRRAEGNFERARRAAAAAGRDVRMSLQIVEDRQVARAVCDYAVEHAFDLLVLGRHGDGAALRSRLGRVAEAAARGSAIPLLLLGAP
jgi:nucleotide-binding universal stress UspA family protein